MSEIHSLDIPVSKDPEWLFLTINRWLNNVDAIMNDVRNNNNNNQVENDNDYPKKLSKVDFRKEAQWLKKVIEFEAYPVVFCHNDLQEGNILYRQNDITPYEETEADLNHPLDDLSPLLISTTTSPEAEKVREPVVTINGNTRKRSLDHTLDNDITDSSSSRDDGFNDDTVSGEPELMIIDFEYCAYNYRAFDLANHFLGKTSSRSLKVQLIHFSHDIPEWTYDYTNEKFPYYYHRRENYPTAKQIDDFVTVYLSHNKDAVPTLADKKQLSEEIALFTLASHMFWAIWGIVNINQDIEFGYWVRFYSEIFNN